MEFTTAIAAIDASVEALKKARALLVDNLEPLMSVEDVATYFRCSPQHVYSLHNSGSLRGRKIGGVIRFERSAVISFGVDITA